MSDDFKNLAAEHLKDIRQLTYTNLVSLIQMDPLTKELVDKEGHEYTSQIRCAYEDKTKQILRISISIFKPREIKPWWQFWKNIDAAVYTENYLVDASSNWQSL